MTEPRPEPPSPRSETEPKTEAFPRGKRAREMFRRSWPHLRAILILLHLAAVLTLCAPPRHRVLDPRNFETPEAIARFETWANRLSAIGISTSGEGLRSFWRGVAEDYASVRDFVGRPAQRYADTLYIGQGWSLFSTPKRRPALLLVDIHEPGKGWRPLYRQRSDRDTWRRGMFDNNRMRKIVGRISRHKKSVGRYVPLGDWLARLAAKEFPNADRLRTRLLRYETAPPGRSVDPDKDGRITNIRVIDLGAMR